MYPKWPPILGFHLFGKINFLSESELCWRIQFWAQSPPVSSPTSWNPFQHSEVQWVVKNVFSLSISYIWLLSACSCAVHWGLQSSVFSISLSQSVSACSAAWGGNWLQPVLRQSIMRVTIEENIWEMMGHFLSNWWEVAPREIQFIPRVTGGGTGMWRRVWWRWL